MVHKSKSKGNRFENKIYKDLRKIIPSLKKTLGSGNSEHDADLVSNVFIIECKHYKKVTKKLLDLWCEKLLLDKEEQKEPKLPILIYKQNYKPVRVVWASDYGHHAESSYENFKAIVKLMGEQIDI